MISERADPEAMEMVRRMVARFATDMQTRAGDAGLFTLPLCRLYSAYARLSYRSPEFFPSGELAQSLAREASERVDMILQAQNTALRVRHGGKGGRASDARRSG